MTIAAALARLDDSGDRFYTFGDPPERFWSVTTIIGGGVPKYLHAHYAKMAADLAYESLLERGPHSRAQAIANRLAARGRADFLARQARGELTSLKIAKQSPTDLALRWLKGAADRHRDAAAAKGSAVHDQAEELVLTHAREATRLYLEEGKVAAWPEDLAGYERSFRDWIEDWHPTFLATEATVLNRTQAFGGTLDAAAALRVSDVVEAIRRSGGEVPHDLGTLALRRAATVNAVVDYKSGRAIYAEVALQLAALARGEFVAHPLGVVELPMPSIDIGMVLHLTPKGYDFKLVRIDQGVFDAFCFAREVYRWRKETAKTAFLADLKPLPRAVEAVA